MSETLRPLVEAAKKGDRQALNTLAACVDRFVRIFSGSLSRGVRRTYGSTIDFVLEGLAEALSRLDEFQYSSDEEFYGWAHLHIRNRIISTARREGRKKRGGRLEPLQDDDNRLAAPDPTPSGVLADEEVRAAAGRAVLELQLEHPEEMEVVTLKVFEDQSWPEIRQCLGLSSEKRARTLFARGADLLRPRVEKSLGKSALGDLTGGTA